MKGAASSSMHPLFRLEFVTNFSVKSGALMRKQPLSYTKYSLFVLSFNVAPYFQLKQFVFF